MADLATRDVVNENQSVGDSSPADVSAVTSTSTEPLGNLATQTSEQEELQQNGLSEMISTTLRDEHTHDETASRSDTESRADGTAAESKTMDPSTLKRPAVAKPVSFQKYIPKVIQNATKAAADRGKHTESRRRPYLTGTSSDRHTHIGIFTGASRTTTTSRQNH